MWYLFGIAAGIFYTASTLLNRRALVKGTDPWTFSFFFSAIGALVSLPFVFVNFTVANSWTLWGLVLVTAALVVFHNFLNYAALRHLSASVHGTFYKFRLIWSFFLGLIFLQESWATLTIIGILATLVAGALLLWQKGERPSLKGLLFVFGASVVNVLALLLYKLLLGPFDVATFTFLMFFIPALLNVLIIPDFRSKCADVMRNHFGLVIVACALGAFANLAMNQSILLGGVTGTLVLIEACLIFILAGEYVFLKETTHVFRKILAVVLATIGAICIIVS